MTDARTRVLEHLRSSLADRYAIEREIGAGGMATVYLAQDLKHHRKVALKVLRAELAVALGAERFTREIQVAAQLQHPHILPLLDSGEAAGGGLYYYVMPYVDGESLRDRLARRGELPVHDAVKVLIEVVDALAHAHAHGVVHRDIKPDNVLLSGRHALVTDFGVAKAVSEATGAQTLTSIGVALGTPAYMAPEQAAADPHLDHRVDLYAVGVLGYELLTGRPPFVGRTPQETLAAHLTQRPEPPTKHRPGISPALSDVLMKCLAKRPADRWQTAEELLAQLEPLATPSGGMTPTGTQPAMAPARRLRGAALVGGAAIALGLVLWLAFGRAQPPRVAIGQTAPVTNDPGLEIDPALSPDGGLIAYAAGAPLATRIYVRQVEGGGGGGRPVLVGDSTGPGQRRPRWSPDGRRILYVAGRSVLVAPALGGRAHVVVTHPRDLKGADWSPDGTQIVYAAGDSLHLIAAEGGAGRPLAGVPEPHSPAWSPDGRGIAVVSGNWPYVDAGLYGNLAVSTVFVVQPRSGDVRAVTDGRSLHASPAWSPDGRSLLFVSNQDGPRDVYMIGVAASGAPRGSTQRLTTGLRPHSITLAAQGRRLAYNLFSATANIWSLSIPQPGPVSAGGARQVTSGNQVIEDLTVSSDGKTIYYDSDRSGRSEAYRMPIDGGEPTQLTDAPGGNYVPSVSPDGREVVFQSQRNGNRDLFLMPAQGGPAQPLVVQPGHDNPSSWSPDGRRLAFTHTGGGSPDGVYVIERSGGSTWTRPRLILDLAVDQPFLLASWRPDGRAISVMLGDSLVETPLDSGPRRVLWIGHQHADSLVPGPLAVARYSPDRASIYFLAIARHPTARVGIWVLPLRGGPARQLVRFDDPFRLPLRGNWSTDGRRFFFTLDERQSDVWMGEVSGLP